MLLKTHYCSWGLNGLLKSCETGEGGAVGPTPPAKVGENGRQHYEAAPAPVTGKHISRVARCTTSWKVASCSRERTWAPPHCLQGSVLTSCGFLDKEQTALSIIIFSEGPKAKQVQKIDLTSSIPGHIPQLWNCVWITPEALLGRWRGGSFLHNITCVFVSF